MSKSLFPKLKCPMSIDHNHDNYFFCLVLNKLKSQKKFLKRVGIKLSIEIHVLRYCRPLINGFQVSLDLEFIVSKENMNIQTKPSYLFPSQPILKRIPVQLNCTPFMSDKYLLISQNHISEQHVCFCVPAPVFCMFAFNCH